MKRNKSKLAAAYFLMIVLWGSAFVGIRIGLTDFSAEHLSLLRLIIASFALIVYAFFQKIKMPDFEDLPALILLGFLGFSAYQTALNIGEKTVNAGTASLLVSITPIFLAVLGYLFRKEKQTSLTWLGSFIAFCGVGLISLGTGGGITFTTGSSWIVIASLSESLYFIFQSRYLAKYGLIPFTAYSIWGATLCMLVVLPGLNEEIISAGFQASVSAIYLGIFPTVIAYLAYSYIIVNTASSDAALSLYLTPIMAFFTAWIFLGEIPSKITILGGAVIFLGLFIAHYAQGQKKHLKRAPRKAAS